MKIPLCFLATLAPLLTASGATLEFTNVTRAVAGPIPAPMTNTFLLLQTNATKVIRASVGQMISTNSPGTNGQHLKTDGTRSYWSSDVTGNGAGLTDLPSTSIVGSQLQLTNGAGQIVLSDAGGFEAVLLGIDPTNQTALLYTNHATGEFLKVDTNANLSGTSLPSPQKQSVRFDDCLTSNGFLDGTAQKNGTASDFGFAGSLSGEYFGYAYINTGTTGTGYADYYWNPVAIFYQDAQVITNEWRFMLSAQPSAADPFIFRMGVATPNTGLQGATEPTDGAYLRVMTNGGAGYLVESITASNTVYTTNALSFTLTANTWYVFRQVFQSNTNVTFSLGSTSTALTVSATNAVNVPVRRSTGYGFGIAKTAGGTACKAYCDYKLDSITFQATR